MDISQNEDLACCEGVHTETPVSIHNQPGLSAIAYRVGTHSRFKKSMLAGLSGMPSLKHLTTRRDDDFTIALLDAWAAVADILTFYQERIANESYLRTATERLSILEIARRIGYELHPGVAAGVYLSFKIEQAPGAPQMTVIPAGTQVQSLPGPGEQAQTFETVAEIPAASVWNAMKPRLTTRHAFFNKDRKLNSIFYLDGTATLLTAGDVLLITPCDDPRLCNLPVFCQVTDVIVQYDHQRTQVHIRDLNKPVKNYIPVDVCKAWKLAKFDLKPGKVSINKVQEAIDLNKSINAAELRTLALTDSFSVGELFDNFKAVQAESPVVIGFRLQASIFGHNAPPLNVIEKIPDSQDLKCDRKWAEGSLADYPTILKEADPKIGNIFLDSTYAGITLGSYVILYDGICGNWRLYQVDQTSEVSVACFTLTGKVTRLKLDSCDFFHKFYIRKTTVYAQQERLPLARLPITDPFAGGTLDLEGLIDGLYIGQGLMVTGELEGSHGNCASEYVTIRDVSYIFDDEGYTRISLAGGGLKNIYLRNTVTMNGNVAPANHGQTRQELLGSGEGNHSHQQFTVHQAPLTYVSDVSPSGVQSTLRLYADDILWREVPAFYGHGPHERIFVTRRSSEGITTICTGDGIQGARLPSGQQNIRTVYRTGIGLAGLVKAGQLSVLLSHPAGVKGVINAMHANGAADPEALDDARQNAPLSVLTLGRIVSLRDYENFARSFGGISKALATWIWNGRRRGVLLTIAGEQGMEIDCTSMLYSNLLMAIDQYGDSGVPLRVISYQKQYFTLSAVVTASPDFITDKIRKEVESMLRRRFGFANMNFGQRIYLSQIIAYIQEIPGVMAVQVKSLYRSREAVNLHHILYSHIPKAGTGSEATAAELLTIDPRPIELTIKS